MKCSTMPLLILLLLADTCAAGGARLHLAVAANFRAAAERLAGDFAQETGAEIIISSASTGVLAAQLRAGAPFDLLLGADSARPAALFEAGLGAAAPQCYAVGGLVLLGADDRDAALADERLSIAIANPETAPYGAAAEAVLGRAGFAGASRRRVVRGSNVLQALQFFDSGAADLALVARSLRPGTGIPIPADWHPAIEQHALVSARSDEQPLARDFLDYLLAARARDLLRSLGYTACS